LPCGVTILEEVEMKKFASVFILLFVGGLIAEQPNYCVECHEGLEEELSQPVKLWKESVHYKNGIACNDCHGGDPRNEEQEGAMDPQKGFVGSPSPEEVPSFCGKCHSAVYENYLQSVHAKTLMEDGTGPNCVTCHTSHSQKKATLNLINEETCSTCHDYTRAERLKEAMTAMDKDLTIMEERVLILFREGMDVESEKKALFALRNRAHRLTHVLDLNRILTELGAVRADLQGLDVRVQDQENVVRQRKRLGAFLVAFFILGSVIAFLYYKALAKAS
jgi:nitrate/TMAO reductase-like tetraheme cytochrome c subunit